ncbi:exocrine gland-secreting peptide 31 precursor [Mus musculus]|uniref:Exocrine gland secreted peptide 31 n=1 Tax=Mus musculus TaxID=10090 RepID=A8R0W3_MOUSE|nr:exocrine gland-secreting peptide 31 precursor [Mus musculus]BAF92746.1 exocrine gland-secreting peptide 31 [Mus musculus]|eukprot:NP_001171057.1 exocrine gland-secreting peptide 31 precursor [Mus musculus]
MDSFPVMCFLLILLLSSMFTEGAVLKNDQEELIDSEDEQLIFIECGYIQGILHNPEMSFNLNDYEQKFENINNRVFFLCVSRTYVCLKYPKTRLLLQVMDPVRFINMTQSRDFC